MYGCFNRKTGEFVDQQDSLVNYGPDKLKDHVFSSYRISSDDLVVVEAGDQPWMKKLVDGKAVDDLEKIAAFQAEHQAEQDLADANQARLGVLIPLIKARTATPEETQEYVALRDGL